MSYYKNDATIDGLKCCVHCGGPGCDHVVIFEREFASIEQIEGINWAQPALGGECTLPAGYGFDVVRVDYRANTRSYEVTVRAKQQYWGDVTGYRAEIGKLQEQLAEKDAQINDLNSVTASQKADLQAKEEQLRALQETVARQTASQGKLEAGDVSRPSVENAGSVEEASE